MRDIQTVVMVLRDDNIPATLTLVEDGITLNSPEELDAKKKNKLIKRFADHLMDLGFDMYDWKDTV